MKTYLFASSRRPTTVYRTVLHETGAITCNCPAFRECWHIKRVREGPVGRTEDIKVSYTDRVAIRSLVHEGNDAGAEHYVFELFPSITLEEIHELIEEIANRELDDESV